LDSAALEQRQWHLGFDTIDADKRSRRLDSYVDGVRLYERPACLFDVLHCLESALVKQR
jgi:hypothetical protein